MPRRPLPWPTLRRAVALVPLLVLFVLPVPAAAAGPFVQTARLTAMDAVNPAPIFGYAVAVSADGNTALVGAPQDTNSTGAVYVFVRSGNSWSQQAKFAGSDAVSGINGIGFGFAVAVSADGNTALVGAPGDNNLGAAFVFTRSAGVWTQQGHKLAGSNGGGACPGKLFSHPCDFGSVVSLSADGNTALIGEPEIGAAFFFVRSGMTWAGQGEVQGGFVGNALALSGDGNTALIGGFANNTILVYARSGGVWTQQANKLTLGTGTFNSPVILSADGNTALVTGGDSNGTAIVYVFVRTGNVWTQQGSGLVGTGRQTFDFYGSGLALSADGNTALIDAAGLNNNSGAAYVFTRSGGVWSQQGNYLTATGEVGGGYFGYRVALSGDGTMALIGTYGDHGGFGAAYVFNSRTLASITLSGTTPITIGQVAQWQASGTFSDAGTQPLSSGTWQSSNAAVATVDASGNVTGQTVGTATITYTLDGVMGQRVVTVTTLNPIGITIPSAPQGRSSGTAGGNVTPAPAPAGRATRLRSRASRLRGPEHRLAIIRHR